MMRIKTIHLLILSALCLLAVVFVYGFVFNVIKGRLTEISQLANQLDFEVKKDQRLRAIKQLTTELGEELVQLDAYFITDARVVEFLEQLEGMGRETGAGLEVNAVSTVPGISETAPFELLRIEFNVAGQWSGIMQLLGLLDTLPYGVVIERMQLERTAGGISGHWSAHVSMTVPKLKQ